MQVFHVSQKHPAASDENPGTEQAPLRTINRAAALARPGATIRVHPGIYRERVNPRRGGTPVAPITYEAAAPGQVFVRGSEIFSPEWQRLDGAIWKGPLGTVAFGAAAYAGQMDPALYANFNPFLEHFNRRRIARPHQAVIAALERDLAEVGAQLQEATPAQELAFSGAVKRRKDLEEELLRRTRPHRQEFLLTLGQVFLDGQPLREVATREDLASFPGSWMAAPEGDALWVHFPGSQSPHQSGTVEISVRHTVFSPLERRLGHIHVRGFVFEHAANPFPTWGKGGWSQAGMVSTRSGHHWVIENNIIRFAKGIGLDCGSEGGSETKENPGCIEKEGPHQETIDASRAGYHLIRGNEISDNGHCGLAGIGHTSTRVVGNVLERNNRDGWTSPWWEFAAIKFHFFYDGLIEGNLIRDNEAHGIWIDNQWRGSRITRNVILNNLWSGINVELGRGPVLIDHNIIALTRNGDGIYGHDVAKVTIAHNLLYANANFGAWFAFATPRVKPEDGCWDIEILNNIIACNRAGALALPLPWQCAGRNRAEANLYVGAGEYLDEGSGSRPPLFQFTNDTHMANMPEFFPEGFEAQSPARVAEKFRAALEAGGLPEALQPNWQTWAPHYLATFEQWRAATGGDAGSKIMTSIRDGLGTRAPAIEMLFDSSIREIPCQPVPGVTCDFHGAPLPGTAPLPGPFQHIEASGKTHQILWPVPPRQG